MPEFFGFLHNAFFFSCAGQQYICVTSLASKSSISLFAASGYFRIATNLAFRDDPCGQEVRGAPSSGLGFRPPIRNVSAQKKPADRNQRA